MDCRGDSWLIPPICLFFSRLVFNKQYRRGLYLMSYIECISRLDLVLYEVQAIGVALDSSDNWWINVRSFMTSHLIRIIPDDNRSRENF